MEHIAIDLGARESQICIRNREGKILVEKRHPTSQLGEYLAKRPAGRVLVESSAEAFTIADQARCAGHEVRVVPAALVRVLGVGERKLKNDQRDARKLSEASCRIEVPTVHVPAQMRREHQARVTAREALVRVRTKLINTVRSFLRMMALPPVRATPKSLPRLVRAVLERQPAGVPDYIEQLLVSIEQLNLHIAQADAELKRIAHSDATCKRLMTMPGVGPMTAICFAATIDDVSRFDQANRVTSYLGLTPGESTTGFKTRRVGMTKAGSGRVRWTLTQAAWALVRTRPNDPLVGWFQTVAGRRGKKVAIVALCRKMAAVLYAMWRDDRSYDPKTAPAAFAA